MNHYVCSTPLISSVDSQDTAQSTPNTTSTSAGSASTKQSAKIQSAPSATRRNSMRQENLPVASTSKDTDSAPSSPEPKSGGEVLAEEEENKALDQSRRPRISLACHPCRTRKVKCDGGKPVCLRCADKADECVYDAAPNRRGPDKRPGTRHRTTKKKKLAVEEGVAGPSKVEKTTTAKRRKRGWEEDTVDDDVLVVLPTAQSSSSLELVDLRPALPAKKFASGGATKVLKRKAPSSDSVSTSSPASNTSPPSSGGASEDTRNPFSELASNYRSMTTELRPDFPSQPQTIPIAMPHHRILPISAQSLLPLMHTSSVPPWPSARLELYSGGVSFIIPSANEYEIDELNQYASPTPISDRDGTTDYFDILSGPSVEFHRKTWWDDLLTLYSPDRAHATQLISLDFAFLFQNSNHLLSFFHVPLFFSILHHPIERHKLQSSIVLAGLALASLMRSSEIGLGAKGREKALYLRDRAQAALDASINAQWIDPTLAQAALLLTFFETAAHPQYSEARWGSSLIVLDNIIRALSLPTIDVDDPSASVFAPTSPPIVYPPLSVSSETPTSPFSCSCRKYTLAQNSTSKHAQAPGWQSGPAWDPDWSVVEIRREEIRRLCWSALFLASMRVDHLTAFGMEPPVGLHITQYANYALLFPGENLHHSKHFTTPSPSPPPQTSRSAPTPSAPSNPKSTVWALYSRIMLLYNSCIRLKAVIAVTRTPEAPETIVYRDEALAEVERIEKELNWHTCHTEQYFAWLGRDCLHNTRMCLNYELQRAPYANHASIYQQKEAEAWVAHLASIGRRTKQGYNILQLIGRSNLLEHRPMFQAWFMDQLSRAVSVWENNNSLVGALNVAKDLIPSIEYMSSLWPSPQRSQFETLRSKVSAACLTAGIPLPPPTDLNIIPTSSAHLAD